MLYQEVVEYIKRARQAGLTDEQIKNELLKVGWDKTVVEESLNLTESQSESVGTRGRFAEQRPLVVLSGAGLLLSRSWQIYKQKAKTFLGIVSVPLFLLLIFSFILLLISKRGTPASLSPPQVLLVIVITLIGSLAFWLVQLWSQVALIYVVKERGGLITIKEAFGYGRRFLISYIWISFVVGFVVMGGLIFFIIPAIIFSVWLSLSVYVLVAEKIKGMNALLRSRQLVSGYWGKVFWRFLILGGIFLLWMLLAVFVQVLMPAFLRDIVAMVFSLLAMPFMMIYGYLIYEELKQIKLETPFEASKASGRGLFIFAGLVGFIFIPVFLITVVLFSLGAAKEKARDMKRIRDIRILQLNLEVYYSQHGSYPNELNQLIPDFVVDLPVDPKSKTSYEYRLIEGGRSYRLCADFEAKEDECFGEELFLPPSLD